MIIARHGLVALGNALMLAHAVNQFVIMAEFYGLTVFLFMHFALHFSIFKLQTVRK